MTFWEGVLVLFAGVWAGAINTVVGSGTLVTFPALLAIGLPPVTANVSNTVGLFPASFVGAWGYRRELEGQRPRAVNLAVASTIGAVIGAVLLLTLPPGAFKAIVPALILFALVLVVFGKRITAWLHRRGHQVGTTVTRPLWLAMLGTGVYGGYFGAAQGVLIMGFLGLFIAETLQRQNALKNVLAGVMNLVSSAVFIATTHIDWAVSGLILAGGILGALIGARIGRRLPPPVLRGVIVVVGLAAVVELLA